MGEKALRHRWRCLCVCLQRFLKTLWPQAAPSSPPSSAAEAPSGASASSPVPPPEARWHILIVEDDSHAAEAIRVALELEGGAAWKASIARSGEEALLMVAAQPVDLILLDVRLPGISGAEVYRRLRAAPATQRLPIIFLSGGTTFDLSREGIEEGILLRKPFNIPELIAMVRANLPDANGRPGQHTSM